MRDIFNICGAYYNGPGTERPSGSFAAAGSHCLPTLIIPKRFLRKRTLCCGGVAHAIVVVVFVVYVMWWRRRAWCGWLDFKSICKNVRQAYCKIPQDSRLLVWIGLRSSQKIILRIFYFLRRAENCWNRQLPRNLAAFIYNILWALLYNIYTV